MRDEGGPGGLVSEKTMSGRQYGTKDYSPRDSARKSPRLSGTTMLRELQERVRVEAERRGMSFSAALSEAAELWLRTPPPAKK